MKPELSAATRNLVHLRIWLGKRLAGSEQRATLFWAVVIGLLGAWTSIGFKEATEWLHTLFTGQNSGFVASFAAMPWWRRILVPLAGGLLAGLTLSLGRRIRRRGSSTDYMEAVVVGNGNLAVKSSLMKCTSAWFSASTGASIGREGPMVLLSALAASVLGRNLKFPLARKRLMVACGAAAPLFLGFLKWSEVAFGKLKLPDWARLALGGGLVGLLAVMHPEVAGNGHGLVFGILHYSGTWQAVALLLAFKVIATGATFGSGAVGGVFTPTLSAGAAPGYLSGVAAAALFPGWGLEPGAFGLVGMGAFLAAATGAPVMAIIMLFELTLNYQILIPAMLASVIGYYVCSSLTTRSLYKDALARKGAAAVAHHLATLKVGDLMHPDSATLSPLASFGEIARRQTPEQGLKPSVGASGTIRSGPLLVEARE
ncbi:MAG: chloride channel protein [Akkermansiaceae bacterium]|nr:chloride channel protein [Akkermansiaceae bacterium]